MTPRLLNLLTLLSLLPGAAACVLWVRSYWVRDTLTWARDGVVTSPQLEDTHRACSAANVVCAYGGIHVGRTQVRTGQFAAGWPPSGFSHTHSDDVDGYPALDASPAGETNIGSMFMWTWGGFQLVSADDSAGQPDPIYRLSHRSATFPLWLPTSLSAAATVGLCRRLRRIRIPGHCPRCGYDLRATPDRCPECGTAAVGGTMRGR